MGTFRFRSTVVAMALVAGSAVGAQIGTVQPAEAQVPLFVITAAQTTPFDIRAGEKVPLAKIFNVQAVVPGHIPTLAFGVAAIRRAQAG